ncbi:UNKNOWN [Stylonychia lemnae]|uniref:Uncharacterized protein n=1 Tax=Stylonychia lemnae TaxID=5949 RepID=A0A078B678_STYLE|nr:UNKNOWN [Stylonychia lemnae]|eukprot:CDW89038.1 UNKNOWN [Stylonychia lemnae]
MSKVNLQSDYEDIQSKISRLYSVTISLQVHIQQKTPLKPSQTSKVQSYFEYLRKKSTVINFLDQQQLYLDEMKISKQRLLQNLRQKFGTTYVFGLKDKLNQSQKSFNELSPQKSERFASPFRRPQTSVNLHSQHYNNTLVNRNDSRSNPRIDQSLLANVDRRNTSSVKSLDRYFSHKRQQSVKSIISIDSAAIDRVIKLQDQKKLESNQKDNGNKSNRSIKSNFKAIKVPEQDNSKERPQSRQSKFRGIDFLRKRKQSADIVSRSDASQKLLIPQQAQKKLNISTSYIKFNNDRVVPQVYIKQKEERMNRTMENVQKSLQGMRRNIPTLNFNRPEGASPLRSYFNRSRANIENPEVQQQSALNSIRQNQNSQGKTRNGISNNNNNNRNSIFNRSKFIIRNQPSPIMNRYLRNKDTFVALFPQYGVTKDLNKTEFMQQMTYEPFNVIEQRDTPNVDRLNFIKRDDAKRYTEEWLKTQNMRGKK